MGYVFDQGNVNTAALTTPGAYVQLDPPDGGISLLPDNAIAHAGTGSYGPVNKVTGPYGDTGSAALVYGQFNAKTFLTDKYDLMRGVMQSLGEAQSTVSIADWLVRISDGTETAASVTLEDAQGTPIAGGTLPAKYTGSGGDLHRISISAGLTLAGAIPSFNVLIFSTYAGTVISESWNNIPGSATGASPFWANLNAILLSGDSLNPPSKLCGALASVSQTAHNPALGTFAFTGGTDGRSGVTSSSFFGSDTQGGRQGVYCLRGLPVVPRYFTCCGLSDSTKFALLYQLTYQEIMRTILPLPAGTSTADAVTARNTNGISDKRIMYAKDNVYWTDPVSGMLLFTDPVSIMMGRMGGLSPELSPLNKQVYSVVATEHPDPYPADEIGTLDQNGILVLANPCLGQPKFGFITASTTSLNPLERPIEYSVLQDWIGLNFASTLTTFCGAKQGVYDPDKTRAACKATVDGDMYELYQDEIIVDWASQIDAVLNTPQSIRAGYLKGKLRYVPFASVKFVFLEIATSLSLSPGQALAAAYAAAGTQ